MIIKGTGEFGNKRTGGNHTNYYIIEIKRNTEKSPGDLKRTCFLSNLCKRPLQFADVKKLSRSCEKRDKHLDLA